MDDPKRGPDRHISHDLEAMRLEDESRQDHEAAGAEADERERLDEYDRACWAAHDD